LLNYYDTEDTLIVILIIYILKELRYHETRGGKKNFMRLTAFIKRVSAKPKSQKS